MSKKEETKSLNIQQHKEKIQALYIGLGKKAGQNLAEKANMLFHMVSVDGEKVLGYPENQEPREDRICVEIVKGQIAKATLM